MNEQRTMADGSRKLAPRERWISLLKGVLVLVGVFGFLKGLVSFNVFMWVLHSMGDAGELLFIVFLLLFMLLMVLIAFGLLWASLTGSVGYLGELWSGMKLPSANRFGRRLWQVIRQNALVVLVACVIGLWLFGGFGKSLSDYIKLAEVFLPLMLFIFVVISFFQESGADQSERAVDAQKSQAKDLTRRQKRNLKSNNPLNEKPD